MAFLETFEWEIFLSYGWARNQQEDRGSRGWAGELLKFLTDRLGRDRENPRIYFDVNAWRVGTIGDELRQAVERSALLVFVVSPGSYRIDSFCQREVAHFWDYAAPLASVPEVLAPENRIFKLVQTPVPTGLGTEPEPLRDLRPYEVFERTEGRSEDFTDLSAAARVELDRFYAQLLRSLDRVKALEKCRRSGSRVFLGPAFSQLNSERFRTLRRELLLEGHEVVSTTSLPPGTETEQDFRGRLQRSHEEASLAVHMVPQTLDLPAQWTRNVAANEIRFSLQKSASEQPFSVYVWKDPDEVLFDRQSLQQIDEVSGVSGNQNTKVMIFEDLKANVKKYLRERRVSGPLPPVSFDVVIEHWDVDSDHAARIRDHLEQRGLIAQFALPTEKRTNRLRLEKKNQQRYYSRATRFVVLYGRGDNEWVDDICYAMKPYAQQDWSGLILLAPPVEPPLGKRYYRNPRDVPFHTEPCFDGAYEPKLDAWLSLRPNSTTG